MNGHQTVASYLITAGFVLLALGTGSQEILAQPDELKATMRIEAPGEAPMEMVYFIRDEQLRMDMSEQASIVWTSGTDSSMLMIQHPEKQYMKWGPDQLRMMQQLMSRMPGGGGATQEPDVNPSTATFEETGRREQIGEWDAFEVKMTQEGQPPTLLWLTTDADTGLFELSLRIAEAASALRMPMAGGGAPSAQQLARYRAMADAQGLPDGRVVRIVTGESDRATRITLGGLMPGPLPTDTFDPPAGYNEMQMPSIPGGIPGVPPGN